MALYVLRKGMKGDRVGDWQSFLRGLNFYKGRIDDDFGEMTHKATKKFQKANGINDDGVVGRQTYGIAISQGFNTIILRDENDEKANWYPPKPDFEPLIGNASREKLFGKFKYEATPTSQNPEKITILDDWKSKNIEKVSLPALAEALDGKYSTMYWHKSTVHQLVGFFEAIHKEGLHKQIISYAGSYHPRFIRGSRKTLSNHSWGTAFDINAPQNWLNREPARIGQKGCLLELVPIANEFGFYWGGHFTRKDGMHFEIAKILK